MLEVDQWDPVREDQKGGDPRVESHGAKLGPSWQADQLDAHCDATRIHADGTSLRLYYEAGEKEKRHRNATE